MILSSAVAGLILLFIASRTVATMLYGWRTAEARRPALNPWLAFALLWLIGGPLLAIGLGEAFGM